ncbi:hypothetical protein FOIG_16943 [Fusarium odoratissimum NRRL 54006]|uniref:Uncharacterized protein n=2 Tax=Fusarium oxysporum species complex TaxID=171631 RepID=X0ILJ5_FUSO5|nr:uncharacterized protein FOIG_16943 [Fusarium odoratissimum NRRL 54006]EXL89773.1 hypothetical protein FOIG_16943 [Fusarium odoratissimum NRRL 54006]TXB97897.1 hypothetical protein FocTR4_00016943 [Fusarium oxysporum f. sp. cubense]
MVFSTFKGRTWEQHRSFTPPTISRCDISCPVKGPGGFDVKVMLTIRYPKLQFYRFFHVKRVINADGKYGIWHTVWAPEAVNSGDPKTYSGQHKQQTRDRLQEMDCAA